MIVGRVQGFGCTYLTVNVAKDCALSFYKSSLQGSTLGSLFGCLSFLWKNPYNIPIWTFPHKHRKVGMVCLAMTLAGVFSLTALWLPWTAGISPCTFTAHLHSGNHKHCSSPLSGMIHPKVDTHHLSQWSALKLLLYGPRNVACKGLCLSGWKNVSQPCWMWCAGAAWMWQIQAQLEDTTMIVLRNSLLPLEFVWLSGTLYFCFIYFLRFFLKINQPSLDFLKFFSFLGGGSF